MKKSELKIGDWVLVGGSPIKIDELVEGIDTLSVYDEETNEVKDYSYDDLSPIPLTEKILEKNGWKVGILKTGGRCYILGWLFLFQTDGKHWQFGHGDHYLTAIEDIHELQHLLWALGFDDDLKI